MSEPTVELDGLVLPAGTIVGHAADVSADNHDPDPHPQVGAWDGEQVTFTPTVSLVVYESDDGPVILRPRAETGRFVDGSLVLDIPPPEGEPWNPLRLWASTGQPMIPAEWGYTMSGLPGVKPRAFLVEPGATIDIGAIVAGLLPDVPPPNYVDLLAALSEMRDLRTEATDAAGRAEADADRAETARDETELISGLTGEDAAVAALLGDDASATHSALGTVPSISPGAGDLMTPLDLWDAYDIPATYADYLAGIRASFAAQLADGTVIETDRGLGSGTDRIYSYRTGHGPHKVLIVSGSHPQESHTYAMGQRWFEQFVTSDHPVMVRLRNLITVEWVACLVPSGYLTSLHNANGVNVNRNYAFYHGQEADPTKGAAPFSEPESQAVKAIIDQTGSLLTLDLHARGPIGSTEVSWTAPSPWMLGDRALVWSTIRQWSTAYADLFGTTIDLMPTGAGPLLANWAAWYKRFDTRQGAHAMTLESNTDLHGSTYTVMTRTALRLMCGLITTAIGAWLARGQVNPSPQPQLITGSGPAGSSSVSITAGGSLVDTSTYTPIRFSAISPATNTVVTDRVRFVVPYPCDVKVTAYGTIAHVSGVSWRGTIGIGVDDPLAPNPSAIAATTTAEAGLTRNSFAFSHTFPFASPDGETIHEARLFIQRNEGGTARVVVCKLLIEYIPRSKEYPLPALRQEAV